MKSASQYIAEGNNKLIRYDYEGAQQDFSRAIQIEPFLISSYVNRAFVRNKLNDLLGEIGDYTEALTINPIYEVALYNRGIARIKSEDFNGAIDDLSKLIELNPIDAKVFFYRAIARDKVSDDNFQEFIGSVLDIIKAFELDHSLQVTECNKKLLSNRMLRYIQIIQKYTREIDDGSNIEQALLDRGDLKEHATDFVGAINDFTKVIEINSNNDRAYFKRAYTYFMFLKNFAKAMDDYDKALKIRPFDEEFLEMRASLKFELGDLQGSLEDLNQIFEQYDDLEDETKENLEGIYTDAIQDKAYIESILNDSLAV